MVKKKSKCIGSHLQYWDEFLATPGNSYFVAPVTLFKHAPFSKTWGNYAEVGAIVEVPNPFVESKYSQIPDIYWIARILRFAGYKCQIEFERLGIPPQQIQWIPFFSHVPKHLGYANEHHGTVLIHPEIDVAQMFPDFKEQVVHKMIHFGNVKTIHNNHTKCMVMELKSQQRYKLGSKVELIDIHDLEKNQIGTVRALVGDRICVSYGVPKNSAEYDPGHFISTKSEHLYPLGWSNIVGLELRINNEDKSYIRMNKKQLESYEKPVLGHLHQKINEVNIKLGMLLEIRNPISPDQIVVARISKVLKYGYFIAKFMDDKKQKIFGICYHATSPYVLPFGFAKEHNIDICGPPVEQEAIPALSDHDYCAVNPSSNNNAHLDLSSVKRQIPQFEVGMRLEAIHHFRPHSVRSAIVTMIAGHLLKILFDGNRKPGTDDEFLQQCPYHWVDSESPDIYPLGWAEMVGHRFEGYPTTTRDISEILDIEIEMNPSVSSLAIECQPPNEPVDHQNHISDILMPSPASTIEYEIEEDYVSQMNEELRDYLPLDCH